MLKVKIFIKERFNLNICEILKFKHYLLYFFHKTNYVNSNFCATSYVLESYNFNFVSANVF